VTPLGKCQIKKVHRAAILVRWDGGGARGRRSLNNRSANDFESSDLRENRRAEPDVIKFEALQLRRLGTDVLRQLDVANTVQVLEARELTDGTWLITFEDRHPDTRFPGFELDIQQEWSPEEAVHAMRIALREKLWICPLCQRRSQIRRIVDREIFRVDCERCGRFEIEHDLLKHLREAYEAADPEVIEQLSRLSKWVGRDGSMPLLSSENWRQLGT
jgi:hypothetical protein